MSCDVGVDEACFVDKDAGRVPLSEGFFWLIVDWDLTESLSVTRSFRVRLARLFLAVCEPYRVRLESSLGN